MVQHIPHLLSEQFPIHIAGSRIQLYTSTVSACTSIRPVNEAGAWAGVVNQASLDGAKTAYTPSSSVRRYFGAGFRCCPQVAHDYTGTAAFSTTVFRESYKIFILNL